MQPNDPYCRIAERGWVEGERAHPAATNLAGGSASLAPLARCAVSDSPLAGGVGVGSGVAAAGPDLGDGPLRQPFRLPPPPAGVGLFDRATDSVLTPACKLRFLDALAGHGNVRVAAARVGVHRSTL